MEFQIIFILVLLVTGALVGFACGMLGVGGGFLMVPVQIWALASSGIDPTIAVRVAFGTSLAVILPTALAGCRGHSCRGTVLWRPGMALGLSGLGGAFLGGTVAAHVPGELLAKFFGLVVLAGALRLLLFKRPEVSGEPEMGIGRCIFLGLGAGIVAGLSGIGGGVVLVPAMVIGLRFSMQQAAGTSSLAIAMNAVGGVLSYIYNGLGVPGLPAYSVGYVNLLQLALLAGTSVPLTWLGVGLSQRLPEQQLRFAFIVLMVYVGVKMLGIWAWLKLPL
jgi:uncharacterized membrane protein YfcA